MYSFWKGNKNITFSPFGPGAPGRPSVPGKPGKPCRPKDVDEIVIWVERAMQWPIEGLSSGVKR